MLRLDLQLFAEEEIDTPEVEETIGDEVDPFDALYEDDDIGDEDALLDGTDDEEDNSDPGNAAEIDDQHPPEGKPWKNQQNADFAAQRRRQEEQQRVQSAVDAEYARMFAGQTNPYTGRPINTKAEYDLYQQQYQKEQLKQAGVDPNYINQLVQNNPAVVEANRIMQEQHQAEGKRLLETQVQEICKLDPDIKNFGDLMACENFGQINDMVMNGYSLTDAYKIANFIKITQRKQAAATQRAINQVSGKAHMRQTGAGGAGDNVSIPADVLSMYQEMMPEASMAQIREHYKRTHKE